MSEDLQKQVAELKAKVDSAGPGVEDKLAMVVFSGELDKILAAMIIATGAAAMDSKVVLFFTFWATAALRDKKKKVKGKNFMSKMFGWMLPTGRNKTKLSNMHMMGMGTSMLKGLMKKQNTPNLDSLFAIAAELGIKIYICEMSMNLMGFKKEEMIDYPNIELAGVATFLAEAATAQMQLFI